MKDTMRPLRLVSISDIQGVNALSPTKPLAFGDKPLCIVYGRNGTGKSGYVRLLKHICAARRPGDLLGNVFQTSLQSQSANLTYIDNGQLKTTKWIGHPLPELRDVDIYDTASGLVYVTEESEVALEPWLLRLFTKLTEICELVKRHIETQVQALVSNKPTFPGEYANTSQSNWYMTITSNTKSSDVDFQTAWQAKDEDELNGINQRLAEINPTVKAITLRRQKTIVVQLAADMQKTFNALSDEKLLQYLSAKADAKAKRLVADQDAKKVFEKAPLTGIGSESWRLLWEAAQKYSIELAYPGLSFPNIAADSRCVLCQRELDTQTRERFQAFEAFINGELQRQAVVSEQALQAIEKTLPEITSTDTLRMNLDAGGIAEVADREMIEDFQSELTIRRQSFLNAQAVKDISPMPKTDIWTRLEQHAIELEKQAIASDEDANGQKRPELEARAKEYKARKWLNQQHQAINIEIARLKSVQKLQAAIELTNTLALSRRKSMLVEELITGAYVNRFKTELAELKAQHLLVDLKKTRSEKAKVYHRITLRNTRHDIKTSDILSEGEFRIVSLAAFLADTEGRGSQTPFIFDDPISSLDQTYEEAAAKRLVVLSKHRQVIVFTHRLSLLALLDKYSEKEQVDRTFICLSRIRIGDIDELPITLMKTKPAVNRLLNERLKAVQEAFQATDQEYEKEATNLCHDIRILLEQIVESDLLCGVVRRYNPEVQTKNKIEYLSLITPDDCKFIDDLMTTYSRYEHSQSDETPIELPKPSVIENDLKKMLGFIEAIQGRRV